MWVDNKHGWIVPKCDYCGQFISHACWVVDDIFVVGEPGAYSIACLKCQDKRGLNNIVSN